MIICTRVVPALLDRAGLHLQVRGAMKARIRASILVTAASVAAALLASPAMASVTWGPLTSYYNHIERSSSHGTFDNVSSVYASVHAWLNDTANDGNTVYTNADMYFYEYNGTTCGGAGSCFVFDRTKESKEYTYTNTPTTFYLQDALHSAASQARASIYTCVQRAGPCPTPARRGPSPPSRTDTGRGRDQGDA